MYVILRPGPYVCAEWDLGGLPSWLFADPNMVLRSGDETFLGPTRRWLQRLAGSRPTGTRGGRYCRGSRTNRGRLGTTRITKSILAALSLFCGRSATRSNTRGGEGAAWINGMRWDAGSLGRADSVCASLVAAKTDQRCRCLYRGPAKESAHSRIASAGVG